MYIELHAASASSFLQGASLPETLVERAAALGYPAIALLDADGVYGAPRFHKAATPAGLKAIIGAELTIGPSGAGEASKARGASGVAGRDKVDGARRENQRAFRATHSPDAPHSPPYAPSTWRLPVLVEAREGYQNLCR